MSDQEKIKNMLLLELKLLEELEDEVQNIMTRLRLHRQFVYSALELRKVVKTDGGLYLFEEEEDANKVLTFPDQRK